MQRRYGFALLGSAIAEVKSAIFGMNSARLYGIEPIAYANLDDGLARLKRDYVAAGGVRSNLRYGYVTRG